MTIYYSLTFLLLAAEMVTFCILVFPLPYTIRKKVFRFLSESPIVAKIAYALKISFIFVGILFMDALQRMFRVTEEAEMFKKGQAMQDVRAESSVAARKFYAQRNMYLTGFCLFLSLVLTRTFYIILDLIHAQEEYAKLKKATANSSKSTAVLEEQSKQIDDLKKKLAESETRSRDFETLKKQAAQQAAEYDRLATEFNKSNGLVSDKKAD
ncbi:B-cell receptor-associated protein 31-like-domain-containing protein [Pisolithus orientalis]|uniref:B-cell receptor-associated protein 31-like-domain-containing protein n=1 Tax=Pisolithus orientalis TaxID=936130 RepID=UPI00222552ED|nr:B-cell receptor-associated protein 31-like-domain-containing protein [Pisolithus orientalis]KAI6002264.1 B-cell receptor-associated protein 31-like-domain-containing protein [Pisolithus orientalis]